MDIQGYYNGSEKNVLTNKEGNLLINLFAPRYQDLVLKGSVYSTGMTTTSIAAATFTTASLDATATPIVGVWNPLNSGKNLVILQAKLQCVITAATTTGPGAFVWLTSTNNSGITTGNAPFNHFTFNASGSVAKGFANVALTGLTNSLAVRSASGLGSSNGNYSQVGTAAGFAPGNNPPMVDNVDGLIIVPPGGVLSLQCTTTPVAVSASSSLIWVEIDV